MEIITPASKLEEGPTRQLVEGRVYGFRVGPDVYITRYRGIENESDPYIHVLVERETSSFRDNKVNIWRLSKQGYTLHPDHFPYEDQNGNQRETEGLITIAQDPSLEMDVKCGAASFSIELQIPESTQEELIKFLEEVDL